MCFPVFYQPEIYLGLWQFRSFYDELNEDFTGFKVSSGMLLLELQIYMISVLYLIPFLANVLCLLDLSIAKQSGNLKQVPKWAM